MDVVRAFERQRGASVTETHAGNERAIRDVLQGHELPLPRHASADLIATTLDGIRVMEVKGRGSKGPLFLIERELDTLQSAGDHGWLYVVWNTTQPPPYELWLVQNPARLAWRLDRPASRPQGAPRGARHEAKFVIQPSEVEAAGSRADLRGLTLPVKNDVSEQF